MALVDDDAPFLRLWDIQIKPCGGLRLVPINANCNQYVLVLAFHSVLSSLAVMARLLTLSFYIICILKMAFMALAALGALSTRICLVFFQPSRRCWCPFSLLRRKVMCVASTTRSSLLAQAPHSPWQKNM